MEKSIRQLWVKVTETERSTIIISDKFSDKPVSANSVDSDQTAPRLFANLSACFGWLTLGPYVKPLFFFFFFFFSNFIIITEHFQVYEF